MTFVMRAVDAQLKDSPSNGRDHLNSVLKHATLAVLEEQPSHGYVILAKLEERIGDLCHFSHAQVYRVLTALEQRGLIAGRTEQVARRPARRVYVVTVAGREVLHRWLLEIPAQTMFFEDDFYLRLPFLTSLDAENRRSMLDRQLHRCRRHLAMLIERRQSSAVADTDNVLRRLVLDAAVRHSEADLEIVERCCAELMRLPGQKNLVPPA